jgi:hypothetical protein
MNAIKLASIGLAAALASVLPCMPAQAAQIFISQSGSDSNDCTFSSPCKTMARAVALNDDGGGPFEITCQDNGDYSALVTITRSLIIDCNGRTANMGPFIVNGSGITVVLRNFSILISSTLNGIFVENGNLIVDNVHFVNLAQAIGASPTSPSKLVVKNSLFENNGAGLVLQPGSGGSLLATIENVTITSSLGGGLKTNSTSGPVTVDVSNSNISYNIGNGLNAVSGGAGGANVLNIKNSVIASNGTAGIQANGANAAALVNNTVLDSNTAGATSAVGGGRILTYGNNSIVGSAGSGFTGPAALQ